MRGRANLHGSILTPRADLREKKRTAAAASDRSRTTVDLGKVWIPEDLVRRQARRGSDADGTRCHRPGYPELPGTDRWPRTSNRPIPGV